MHCNISGPTGTMMIVNVVMITVLVLVSSKIALTPSEEVVNIFVIWHSSNLMLILTTQSSANGKYQHKQLGCMEVYLF